MKKTKKKEKNISPILSIEEVKKAEEQAKLIVLPDFYNDIQKIIGNPKNIKRLQKILDTTEDRYFYDKYVSILEPFLKYDAKIRTKMYDIMIQQQQLNIENKEKTVKAKDLHLLIDEYTVLPGEDDN